MTSIFPADALGTLEIGEDVARAYIRVPIGITSLTIVIIEFAFFSLIANDYSRRILQTSSQARNAIATKSAMMAGMSHEIRTPMNGVIGMDEDMIARLFRPFSQSADGANSKYAGSGLGLSIVHNLVKKMSGDIEVTSRLGAGSRFTVYLPLQEVDTGQDLPQFEGTSAIVYVTYHRLNFGIRSYLEAMGLECTLCSDEKSFVQALRSTQGPLIGVIGLAGDTRAATVAVFERVRRDFGDVPFLTLISDRTRAFGLVENGSVNVYCSPLLPSALWEGVLLLLQAPDEAEEKDADDKRSVYRPERVLNILIAEDSEINKYVILSQIEQLGHICTVASNGKFAFEYWETGVFDLVLTDCDMPVMDRFELTGKIRAFELENGRKRTPVIAITASALPGEAEKCFIAGMDDYLAKPVQLEALNLILQKWS